MDAIKPSAVPSLPPAAVPSAQNKKLQETFFQKVESLFKDNLAQTNSVKNANNSPIIPALKSFVRDLTDFSMDSINSILGKISSETDTNRLATMKELVDKITLKIAELTAERREILDKNHTEQVKANKKNEENKRKSSGIFGWLRRIFKAVVAVLTVVAAAVATVATGGTAAPLLAMAVFSLASTALSIAGELSGKDFSHITQWMDPGSLAGKGMGALAKKLGASDADAAIVSASFAIAVTLVVMVASALLSGGATLADGIGKAVAIGGAIAGMVEGAISISVGLSDREVAEIERDISSLQSQLQKILAYYFESSQQRQELMEDIKTLVNKINDVPPLLSKMAEEYYKSISQCITNMTGTLHA